MALATTTTYSGSTPKNNYKNKNYNRRPSAASVSITNSNFFLSPNSAFPEGFNKERRRNSYAGDNQIPELFIYSPENMSPTLASHGGTSQQHFLTPMGSFRRRLPPTPLDLANGKLSGSQDALLPEDICNNNNGLLPSRRTSSPRVLPTPPSPSQQQYSPNSCGSQNSPLNMSYEENNNILQQQQIFPPTSPFERRRSSMRRQLPSEPPPTTQQQQNNNNNLIENNLIKTKNEIINNNNLTKLTIIENVENNNDNYLLNNGLLLQRSCSTRSTRKIKTNSEDNNIRGTTQQTNKTNNLINSSPRQKQRSLEHQQHNNTILINDTNIDETLEENENTNKKHQKQHKFNNSALNSSTNNFTTNTRHLRTLSSKKLTTSENVEMPQHQRLSLTEEPTESIQIIATTRPVASSLGAATNLLGNSPRLNLTTTKPPPLLTLNNKKEDEEKNQEENEENKKISKASISSGRQSLTSTNSISPSISINNSALTPPPPSQAFFASSAPSSPRELYSSSSNCSSSRKYSASSGSACSSDSTTHPQMSAALTDLAAISALNSRCNRSGPGTGSMAHLLEQQHILRREFTNGSIPLQQQQQDNNNFKSQSNSSSSLSMEQLNCNTTTVPTSRSGSDIEISTTADPSVLGFDPSLYINGINNSNGHTSPLHVLNNNGIIPSTSCDQQQQNNKSKGLGLLHCTLQHFPVRKRLRVNVLKIEGLAGDLRPDLEIQPFCKLTLTSTNKKQQTSTQTSVIKRGRDAVFNQEFFFDNFVTEEIELKQLQIEVCHSSNQKLQRDLDIGEVRIPLRDLSPQLQSKKEVKIIEELKFFISSKKLGKLYITTCIEKADRRLTINLIKVEDLPKWGIIGAPDVQIRIKMQQSNGQEVVKCSRIIKNTTTAVYKEAVMFLVSTREADLARTKITISIHDLSRSVTGNDTIGYVFLGELASDKSEIDQWRSTMDHWGKEYKAVHTLKCPSIVNGRCQPTLHVLDVQDENDIKENDD